MVRKMYEGLIGKLVVAEFERDGRPHRTICRLRAVENGILEFESPTKKETFVISSTKIRELSELSQSKIRPDLVKP
jgi:hypothetical protein